MRVFIMGMGWLGTPLAHDLLNRGHDVRGTYRSPRPDQIESASQFEIGNTALADISDSLSWADAIVFAIPPSSWLSDYLDKDELEGFLTDLSEPFSGRAILISSTGVFASEQAVVDETTIPEPDSDRGKALVKLESGWKKAFGKNAVVLRLGGLVGGDRHPVRYLSGRSDIKGPRQPVNLIDRQSVIELVEKILLSSELKRTVYHGVSSFHPDRETFYRSSAESLGIPLPQFDQNDQSNGKLVNAELTQNEFKLTYREEDLYP